MDADCEGGEDESGRGSGVAGKWTVKSRLGGTKRERQSSWELTTRQSCDAGGKNSGPVFATKTLGETGAAFGQLERKRERSRDEETAELEAEVKDGVSL